MTCLLVLALVGCIESVPASETCEQTACAYVPLCSPLTTGAWDWRSELACLESFSCGRAPGACLDAIEALPCLSSLPTYDEQMASLRAIKLLKLACHL